jgi:cell division protein FtsZ
MSSFDPVVASARNAVIKVISVGGGGGNALDYMLEQEIEGVECICINTDAQALRNSRAKNILQLGEQITKGLGAGANPEIGRQAADADREKIRAILEGADMVFITAGMGGGTGTGAAPIVVEVADQLGILTVAVVTKPFAFEGRKRAHLAEIGIKQLSQFADSLITIPNDKLMEALGKNVTLLDAFKAVNNVLYGAVQGITELITKSGLINVDFADVRTVMSEMGMAMMGTGLASGEDRAKVAAELAIASPLLDDVSLAGARGVLVNITSGLDLSMGEFYAVGEVVKGFTSENATVVIGTVIDPEMSGDIKVTIVATGLGQQESVGDGGDTIDYYQLERPAVLRRKQIFKTTQKATNPLDNEYLDIPAFLRKQEEVAEE